MSKRKPDSSSLTSPTPLVKPERICVEDETPDQKRRRVIATPAAEMQSTLPQSTPAGTQQQQQQPQTVRAATDTKGCVYPIHHHLPPPGPMKDVAKWYTPQYEAERIAIWKNYMKDRPTATPNGLTIARTVGVPRTEYVRILESMNTGRHTWVYDDWGHADEVEWLPDRAGVREKTTQRIIVDLEGQIRQAMSSKDASFQALTETGRKAINAAVEQISLEELCRAARIAKEAEDARRDPGSKQKRQFEDSQSRLMAALFDEIDLNGMKELCVKVERGHYNEIGGLYDNPQRELVRALEKITASPDLIRRVRSGEFA